MHRHPKVFILQLKDLQAILVLFDYPLAFEEQTEPFSL